MNRSTTRARKSKRKDKKHGRDRKNQAVEEDNLAGKKAEPAPAQTIPWIQQMRMAERAVTQNSTLTQEEAHYIINMFDCLDTDRDHELTREEAGHLFRFLGYTPLIPLGSSVPLKQFLLIAGLQKSQFNSGIDGKTRHTFRMMDPKEKGSITAKQLRLFMKDIGMEISIIAAERVAEIISEEGDFNFGEQELVEYIVRNNDTLEKLKVATELKEKQRLERLATGDYSDDSDDSFGLDPY
uniref:EF-hand domain-containing protein n=1 Tax=Fibrocapsa japonica TaxID=94617 RepID=A0A7S2V3C8_9STRA|mmetsp:Transcript_24209/g.35202  ORF Transcript_24209/g.35202 Transcript_24209/m.35202 type:complete len:239 (+) Transcript_24209:29-745(+)